MRPQRISENDLRRKEGHPDNRIGGFRTGLASLLKLGHTQPSSSSQCPTTIGDARRQTVGISGVIRVVLSIVGDHPGAPL